MIYSKGISWIGDCRIPFVDDGENTKRKVSGHQKVYGSGEEIHYKLNLNNQSDRDKGRFTPNLLVSDDVLNDGTVTSQGNVKLHRKTGEWGKQRIIKNAVEFKGDKGSNSRYYDIDLWFNHLINKLDNTNLLFTNDD